MWIPSMECLNPDKAIAEMVEKEYAEKRRSELNALAKEYVYLSMLMDQFYLKIKDDSTRFFEFVVSNFLFYYYGNKASKMLKKLSVAIKTIPVEEAKEIKDIIFGRAEEMKKVLK